MNDKVRFKCDRCRVESWILAAANDSVYVVVERIRAEHDKKSPNCMGDLSTIKLLDAPEKE